MSIQHRSVRYRVHAGTKAKYSLLERQAGACRFVRNHFIGELQRDYRETGECEFSFYSLGKRFTQLRNLDKTAWLKKHSAAITRSALQGIEQTYRQYFNGQGGLPKFHGKWATPPSFTCPHGTFKLNGEWLHLQKIGYMKLVGANPYPEGEAREATLRREAGDWYAYVVYEVEAVDPASEETPTIGIDRNAGQIALSTGEIIHTPDASRLEAKLRRYQRRMARRQAPNRKQGVKPSNRYLKAKRRCQKASREIRQARNDWAHQVSNRLRGKCVAVEDLDVKGMTASAKGTKDNPGRGVKRKARMNRAILASTWGQLLQLLEYKGKVIKVPPHFTSQRCYECGAIDKKSRRSQSKFVCTACGHRANADINAALNILAFGNGATARGGGEVVPARPVKRETDHKSLADLCI